jgi:hypothetical protein
VTVALRPSPEASASVLVPAVFRGSHSTRLVSLALGSAVWKLVTLAAVSARLQTRTSLMLPSNPGVLLYQFSIALPMVRGVA